MTQKTEGKVCTLQLFKEVRVHKSGIDRWQVKGASALIYRLPKNKGKGFSFLSFIHRVTYLMD